MTPKQFRAAVTADIHALLKYYAEREAMEIDTDYYDRAERAEDEREARWEEARARRVCAECGVMGGHNAGCPAEDDYEDDCDAD